MPTALSVAVECLPFGVAVTDAHGIVIWANAAFDELPGQSAGEFPFDELSHGAPSPRPWTREAVCRRKTGEVYTARHSLTTLRDTAGEATGFWITKEDTREVKPDGKAPHHAEANLSALLESTQDLVWSVDLNHGLLTYNRALQQAFERIPGVRAAVGMRPEDLLPPAAAALWPPLYDHAVSEGPFRTEFSVLDGRTLEMVFNPIVQDGETTGISVFGKDITERKKAERALLEAERKYRDIFDGALEGIYRTTIQGQFLAANPALARMLGYDSAQEAASAISDLAHQVYLDPNDRLSFVRLLEERGATRGYECQLKRKDGTPLWVSISGRKVFDPDQPSAYYEGFVEDITERKRAEAAIQQANEAVARAERHYRLIFNSVSDAVFVHAVGEDGLPGQFLEVNDNACQQVGYTREELLRMRMSDIIPPERQFNIPIMVKRLLAEGQAIWEGRHLTKNGRRIPVELNTHLFDLDGSPTMISSVRDISERKEAERKYRNIFDGALEGIYRTSIEGRNLEANFALARMLGYDSAQEVASAITGSAHQMWVDPNEFSHFLELLEHHGAVRGHECQYKRKDGTAIWVSLSSRKVCGEDGRTLYYEGFIQDITEHKRMEESLRKSEEKFAKAFLCSPAVVTLSDLTEGNRLVDVNEAFEQVSGYRREEAIGRNAMELGLWADPGECEQSETQFRLAGRVRNFEHRFRKKNGDIGIGLTSSELIELDGKPFAISATIDITEQKKTETALRSLVTAIEQAGETIVITDIDGTIQYCNPAFGKITGYSKEEAIGKNPRVLKSGKHSPEFYEQLWATITQGQVWTGHLINKKKDGSLYEEDATISPIRDGSSGISGFVAVKRDVTERLQLERQFLQAQKLETVGRLAGGMAHDFNNLLTIINGYSDLLLKQLKAPDPLTSYAEEIRKAGERAAGLTKQLLAFSRKQVIEPRVLDLNTTIRESMAMLRRLIGEDVALAAHLCDSLGQVTADPDQIHQVIMNLVVNARDAMPDGGNLNIDTANADLGEDSAASLHPDAIPGRYVLMTVTDTGHGMDETIRQHIFEPFFTTKEVGRGTGLGLSTVYGIIRQSGGWIDVWSEVGAGTSFKVYLPRIDECLPAEVNGIKAPTEEGLETILVVEDQEAVRTFTKAALKHYGYHVIEASDGEEALAVIQQHAGQIHLLLTDVVLPGMNGRELSERLKELRPNLRVLFVSGYAADVIAHHGKLDGGVAYIPKPFSPDALAAKVREVLNEKTEVRRQEPE